MPSRTFEELQELSQLPDPVFENLRDTIRQHLRNQADDSIGLAGPGLSAPRIGDFLLWTTEYLDSGIGQKFWGTGTSGKWTLAKNRVVIVDFFRRLVVNEASVERGCRRKEYKRICLEVGGPQGSGDPVGEVPANEMQHRPSLSTATGSSRQNESHGDPDASYMGDRVGAPGVPGSPRSLRSSARKRILEGSGASASKRTRLSMSEDIDPGLGSNDQPPRTPGPSEVNRVFRTHLGPCNIITPVLAPLTIDFRGFLGYFCEAWGIQGEVVNVDNVNVKVSISGSGQYQVGLGRSREGGWSYLMKLAGSIPESEIVVHLEGGKFSLRS